MPGKFRELSFASPDQPRLKRWTIQTIERVSGRPRFLPLYQIWKQQSVGISDHAMHDALQLIGTNIEISAKSWPPPISNDTPLIMVANHPFGIGDGITALALAEDLGRPFRVLINAELLKVPEARPYALPIDFSETPQALATNIATRREAIELLKQGVIIIIFPAGGVATARRPFGVAEELPWKTFVAKMIHAGRATILPVYFEGQNGPLFHLASHVSMTLRLSLLVSEFRRFAGSKVSVRVGDAIPYEEIAHIVDRRALTDELFARVHALRPAQSISKTTKK